MTSYLLPPKKQHKDESEFLELRQRIKESIRMKKKIQNGNVIASPTSNQTKTNHFGLGTKVTSTQSSMFEKKRKVEKLKDSRDYSFLFSDDDAKLPIPRMKPPSRNVSIPISRPSSKEIHSKLDPPRKQDSVLVDHRRKLLSSDHREQRKVSQELIRSSQKVPRQSSQQANQLKKKKKIVKMSEDDGKALRMVREMFKTNRYAGREFDDDDECMEANFEDILKEEKRSERLAKKEDAEQQRLIEEEERRERVRKKQKLSH